MEFGSFAILLVSGLILMLVVKLHRDDIALETQLNQQTEDSRMSSLPQSDYAVYMMVQAAEAIALGRYPMFHKDHQDPNPDDNPENVRV